MATKTKDAQPLTRPPRAQGDDALAMPGTSGHSNYSEVKAVHQPDSDLNFRVGLVVA